MSEQGMKDICKDFTTKIPPVLPPPKKKQNLEKPNQIFAKELPLKSKTKDWTFQPKRLKLRLVGATGATGRYLVVHMF